MKTIGDFGPGVQYARPSVMKGSPVAYMTAPAAQTQQASDLTFGGSRNWRKNLIIPAFIAAALSPLSFAFAQTRGAHDIPNNTTVNRPSDTPWINRDSRQRIYEIKDAPLTSVAAYQKADQILQECLRDPNCGDMKMVFVPRSNNGNIVGLSTDYYNQMQLGTKEKNDGVVVVVDVSKFKANQPNRYGFAPGHGFKEFFGRDESNVRRVVGEQVMSLVARASQTSNQAEAQRLWDEAIVNTAQIFTGKMREYKQLMNQREADARATEQQQVERARQFEANRAETARKEAEHQAWLNSPEGREAARQEEMQRQAEAQRRQEELEAMMKWLLAALVAMGGLGAGAYLVVRHKRKVEAVKADMEAVKTSLNQMGSGHKVTADNVYSPATLEALLAKPGTENYSSHDLIQNIERILKNVDASEKDKAYNVVLSQGMLHPSAEIRRKSAVTLVSDGVSVEEFKAFTSLVVVETDHGVLDAMVRPMAKAAQWGDVKTYSQDAYLKNTHVGIRELSIEILNRFQDENTANVLLGALETETDSKLIQLMQNGVAQLAKKYPAVEASLADKIQPSQPLAVRQAALRGYTLLGKQANFDVLSKSFLAETTNTLVREYQEAMDASFGKDSLPKLYELLKGPEPTPKAELLALGLIEKHPDTANLEPLYGYLKRSNESYSAKAAQLIIDNAADQHRPFLVAEIKAYRPDSEDKEPMLAVIKALKKLANPEDSQAIFDKLEESKELIISSALYEAAEVPRPTKQNFEYYSRKLLTSKKEGVRKAAALVLDDYGMQALAPLFEAMGKTTAETTSKDELDAFNKAIQKIGGKEEALASILSYAASSNAAIKNAAVDVLKIYLTSWKESAKYDDNTLRSNLKAIIALNHSGLKSKAQDVYDAMVEAKAEEVKQFGRTASVTSQKSFDSLKAIEKSSSSYEEPIRKAAKSALTRLNERLDTHNREQERLRQEAAAAAALLAAQRAAERARQEAADAEAAAERARRATYHSPPSPPSYYSPPSPPSWSSPPSYSSPPSCSSPPSYSAPSCSPPSPPSCGGGGGFSSGGGSGW